MTRRFTGPRRLPRAAFTMVELLVVVAIIAVLVALLTVGVSRARLVAKRTQSIAEIAQLSNALAAFKQDRRINWIPSHLDINGVDPGSARFLKSAWPMLPVPLAATPHFLEGDQVLVFLLGGAGGTAGFTKSPTAPFAGGGARFFEFPINRLVDLRGDGHPSFSDPFGQPYLLFSSYGQKKQGVQVPFAGYSMDCPTLASGFVPYFDNSGFFINPTGFQIISAGQDKTYGTGGHIFPGAFQEGLSFDADNLADFNAGPLVGYGL